MFKIFKNILLSLLISNSIFAMTDKQYENHLFHKISVLAKFLDPKVNEESRQKTILQFIDFFLKGEELAIKQENSTNYSNKLSNEYIEQYFEIKKEYYKSFFKDKSKYFVGASPLEYIIRTISDGYNNKNSLIDNFTSNPNKDYLKFLHNYVIKYVKDANLIVGNASYDVISDNEINEKSNNILKNRINGLIKKVIVGDLDINSIIGFYFENNINKNMNELADLLNDNKTLFSFDNKEIIYNNILNLRCNSEKINESFDGFIKPIASPGVHENINYHDQYIIDLLSFFINNKKIQDAKAVELAKEKSKKNKKKNKKNKKKRVCNTRTEEKAEEKNEVKTFTDEDGNIISLDSIRLERERRNIEREKTELKRLEAEKVKQEKLAEEQRIAAEKAKQAKIKAEEEKKTKMAAEQKAIEERKKQKEVLRKAQEARIAEKKAKQEEANKKAAEEAKIAEEQRIAAEKAKQEEANKKAVEETKIAEEQRKAELEKARQEKLAEEAEKRKQAQQILTLISNPNRKDKLISMNDLAKIESGKKILNQINQFQNTFTLVSNSNGQDDLMNTTELINMQNHAIILVSSLLTDILSIKNIYSQSKILTTIDGNLKIRHLERMGNLEEEIKGCFKCITKKISVYENYNRLLDIKEEIDVNLEEQNNYIHRIEEAYLATSSIGFYDGDGNWYPNPSKK